MKETILLTDGYKLDHRRQYPKGTEYVYSNWTPRSCQHFREAEEGTVVFGIQYFIKEYIIRQFNENFFNKPKEIAINDLPVEVYLSEVKPYLFPLSSMTEEQRKEWQSLMIKDSYGILYYTIESYGYLIKNNFDYRGLIPKGLAIDKHLLITK